MIASSPAVWPKVSLIPFRLSRSIKAHTARLPSFSRLSRMACSIKPRRLYTLHSGSYSDRKLNTSMRSRVLSSSLRTMRSLDFKSRKLASMPSCRPMMWRIGSVCSSASHKKTPYCMSPEKMPKLISSSLPSRAGSPVKGNS
ncbi:hypothetical protein SDC9_154082 [bioreactor metagenome]|uniref:Uncharacterized protein n=1 Tax=bioreactor metagenome TaxID=1076179 RepID=A0A645EXP3_9ZZZZ